MDRRTFPLINDVYQLCTGLRRATGQRAVMMIQVMESKRLLQELM